MRSRGCFLVLLVLAFLLATAGAARAVEAAKFTDSFKRDYFLFTPDHIDPDETYWLVVDVHAVGGHGSATSGVRDWVKRGGCIGVSPSFPDGYQSLGLNTDQQLLAIFKKLRKDFKLHDKLFIYGHSAGAAGDVLAKLREIYDAFAGSAKVQAAAVQAAARIKNRPL